MFSVQYRQISKSDLRVVAHKSCALAAENFMISMAAYGYDTCPMEGFDSLRTKRTLIESEHIGDPKNWNDSKFFLHEIQGILKSARLGSRADVQ